MACFGSPWPTGPLLELRASAALLSFLARVATLWDANQGISEHRFAEVTLCHWPSALHSGTCSLCLWFLHLALTHHLVATFCRVPAAGSLIADSHHCWVTVRSLPLCGDSLLTSDRCNWSHQGLANHYSEIQCASGRTWWRDGFWLSCGLACVLCGQT